MKPAEETPGTALVVARALQDAGLPAGVLNIVFGVPPQVSTHLISSPVIRKASFTGSVEVGRTLARLAADHLKPITLELGGHAPVLVFEDADVEKAAAMTVATKFRFGGQVCSSPTRFLVHESVYEDFIRRVAEGAAAIAVGDGLAPDSQMGPLANARRLRAMEQCVADALARGARLACGGKRIGERGYFFHPTVLADVPLDSEIMNREPFGPVFAVRPFRDEAEAVAEANRLPLGLAAYAFTRSPARAETLVEGVESGLIGINTYSINVPETPFGGLKHSGYGAEGGQEGVRGYLIARTVATAL
jgi:succinate-semialdehyde dehydrogenase/glutarate-semialdehyde dehydrogenase